MNNHLIFLEMEMVDAVAFLDYHGKTPEELSFGIHQKISLEKRINSHWWFGHLAETNLSGLIPDSCIKLPSKYIGYFSSSSSINPPPPQVVSRTIYDVLPNSTKVHEHSTSPEDFNRTLHEIFSDIDPPDLVLNLPIVHSTIIIDVKKKIPPPVMKKSEKTMQFIQRLGLGSLSASSKVTEV